MEVLTHLTDIDLVNLLKQDKRVALRELYDRYWRKLYNDAYKRLKSKELSEEIVQEIFTNLWLKRDQLKITGSFGGYLHTAVTNHIIDQFRKESVRAHYREAFRDLHTEMDDSTQTDLMLKELRETIAAEVSRLPDKCRSVYELSRNEHKSNKEIAQELSISEKTVENHITNAIKRLRLGLSHYLFLF